MRTAEITRETKETRITIRINLDGSGTCEISSGIPFFDHMLNSMARHGHIDLVCTAKGDLAVDAHHTVEDIGIVLGEAIRTAAGEGKGIRRFAHAIIPMDEALATVALDYSNRGYLMYQGSFSHHLVGEIERDIFEHFFQSLCVKAGLNAHIEFHGRNDHHQCEATFKAFGIALGEALSPGRLPNEVPSTKGVL